MLGNEIEFLSFIDNSLQYLKSKISNDKFSYNFIPGYVRKLTHYAIMENILNIYNNGIVIVINGNGTKSYRKVEDDIIEEIVPNNDEPSKQIENYVNGYDGPVFLTGFHCIGMSVTLINEKLGNFDNVIVSHEQYVNNPDILYQLCRFVFNYISWNKKDKNIKITNIYCADKKCIDICKNYESQIDIIVNEMNGICVDKETLMGKYFLE